MAHQRDGPQGSPGGRDGVDPYEPAIRAVLDDAPEMLAPAVLERLQRPARRRAARNGTLERALRRYVRVELLVVDDFAVLAMDPLSEFLAIK
jgi:hypothetical protein